MAQGIKKAKAQKTDILPKWWCQKCGAASGQMAMLNSMHTKGITQIALMVPLR
jgi:hypothetical protein